jgi:outer membrane lipase/esterase
VFWIAIPLIMVLGLSLKEPAAQECTGTPFGEGFDCDGFISGPVFTPSTGLSPSPLVHRTIEELVEEEKAEQEVGGGASADWSGLGLFLNGLTVFKDVNNEREWGYNSETFGVSIGADYGRDNFVVGAALDYSYEDARYRSAGEAETNEFGLQLTGIAYPIWDLYLAGTTRFAYDDYETKRSNGAKGSPDGFKISVAGGPGYDFNLGRGFVVGLSSLLRWEWAHVGSYNEHGGQVLGDGFRSNLKYQDDDVYYLTSILEINGQKSFSVPWGVLIPEIIARYNHEFRNNPRTIKAEPIGAPGNIRFSTNKPDRDYYDLGVAVTTVLPAGPSLFVDYHAELGHSYREEHVVNFGVRTNLDYLFGLTGNGFGAGS